MPQGTAHTHWHTHGLAVRRTDGLANSRTGLGARSAGSDGGATTTLTAATTTFLGGLMASTDKLELIDGERRLEDCDWGSLGAWGFRLSAFEWRSLVFGSRLLPKSPPPSPSSSELTEPEVQVSSGCGDLGSQQAPKTVPLKMFLFWLFSYQFPFWLRGPLSGSSGRGSDLRSLCDLVIEKVQLKAGRRPRGGGGGGGGVEAGRSRPVS